jgi:hypothetical protein
MNGSAERQCDRAPPPPPRAEREDNIARGVCDPDDAAAGLDKGLLSLSLSNLLYMENPYSYKKFQ